MAIFSIELYVAHRNGCSLEQLSAALNIPVETIAQRIEAARLCVNFQFPMLREGC